MVRLLGMRPYSEDLRARVIHACEAEGLAHRVVAKRFVVSPSFVEKRLARWRRTGSVAPRPHTGGHPSPLAAVEAPVRQWLVAQPDLTLAEVRTRLAEECTVATSRPARSRWLARVGLARKKRRSTPSSATARRSRPSGGRGPRRLPGCRPRC